MNDRTAVLESLYGVARWLMVQDRTDDAIHMLRAMILTAPDDERGWLGLGACHEARGEIAIASELYATATFASPAPRCLVARARLLRNVGDDDGAAVALDAAEAAAHDLDDEDVLLIIQNERRAA